MQRMTKLPLTSRPPNETSALLSVNKRSSAEEDEIKPCAKSAFSCPLFTTFFFPQLSKAPSTNGQSFLRRYFHNHYFNYFYGALSIAEWWLFLFTAALLLLRLTLMVYFHHNGRAGRVAEYTMVICILFSLRSGARFGSMLGIHGKNLMVLQNIFLVFYLLLSLTGLP